MTNSGIPSLIGGFSNKASDSTACYGILHEATSNPATIFQLPVTVAAPRGLMMGAVVILLTLADAETPVWLAPECDTTEARAHLLFHTGCPIVAEPELAAFAVMSVERDLSITKDLGLGLAEYPDRTATVILESERLIDGEGPLFHGPGMTEPRRFCVEEHPPSLWVHIAANQALFPRGVDWIFASPTELAALPRSTKIEL